MSRLIKLDGIDFPLTSLVSYACQVIRRPESLRFTGVLRGRARAPRHLSGGFVDVWRPASGNVGVMVAGQYVPGRSANHRWGTRSPSALQERFGITAENVWDTGKYLYWRALNTSGRHRAARLTLAALPYPKPGKTALRESCI